MDKRLEIQFDENLRDIPCDPQGLQQYVEELCEKLKSTSDPKKCVALRGEIGVYQRTLGKLEDAEQRLLEALELIKSHQLGIASEIQQKIRLAHVLQWKKSFSESTALFNEVIATCRTNADASKYLAFALQHAGKNLFDQEIFKEALEMFEKALSLRLIGKAPDDQIESSKYAIQRTKQLFAQ